PGWPDEEGEDFQQKSGWQQWLQRWRRGKSVCRWNAATCSFPGWPDEEGEDFQQKSGWQQWLQRWRRGKSVCR
ncbi:hypothetical protein CJ307_35405, partial [Klebsiella quasipneumoniae]